MAITRIEHAVHETLFRGRQYQDMGLCQVGHMDMRTRISQSAILSPLRPPCANQAAEKPGHDLVELREVTKHTRRIPRCHTSRRDVLGDDAACTNDGAAADADAGKDDRL